jgi:hypothetical protein
MKTKLNFSKENLHNARPYIILVVAFVVVAILDIYLPLAYYNNEPAPVVISVKSFNGLVVYSDQTQGISSAIKVSASFNSSLYWGSDAIMICRKSFAIADQQNDLITFRPSKQSCGVFEYATYDVDWKFLWCTECVVYDSSRQWIVCYPRSSSWLWIPALIVLIICVAVVGNLIPEIKTKLKKTR